MTASNLGRPRCTCAVLVAIVAALALTLTGCSAPTAATTETSPAAGADLFDSSVVHDIAVSFAQEDYDAMIEAYKNSGDKDWIEATVTIDGETYERAGLRLKGNSSLRGLRGGFRTAGPSGGVPADAPEELPWLIRLDENVEGQDHQGIVELVVRSNNTETSLNEAVSLELLRAAGLASQDAVAARFAVYGGGPVLRLVTENPDDMWMAENFDDDGALYKAESTGDYSYRGTDSESYDEVFDQEAGKDNADLSPLIAFLDFINNADDANFAAELPQRVEVESLATYLAMEELLANFDDIDGPGNNSYLYYDIDTGIFTVVPWDHNLAFGVRNGGARTADAAGVDQGGRASGETAAAAGEGAARRNTGRGKVNVLVERFRADPGLNAMYEERLVELRETLYESGAAAEILAQWVDLLQTQAADLVPASTVQSEAASIAAYFTGQ